MFTVLTRTPTDDLHKIHDRMPLILPENAINDRCTPSKIIPESVKLKSNKNAIHPDIAYVFSQFFL